MTTTRETIVYAGTLVRSQGVYTDLAGDPDDPEIVVVCYRVNNGEVTNLIYGVDHEVIRDDIGIYHLDIDTTGMATQRPVTLTTEWASKPDTDDDTLQVVNFATARINVPPMVPAFA